MPDAPTRTRLTSPNSILQNLEKALRLEVYVSSECLNCSEAVQLANEVSARHPTVMVRIIDLDELDGNPPPDPVVAVPTYLLNGRVVSLGNPYREDLFARLRETVE